MPYQSPDPFATIRGNLTRAGMPVTIAAILVATVLYLIDFFTGGAATQWMGMQIDGLHISPFWGVLTYPLVHGTDFISFVFTCMWFWFIGGSLERSWGLQRYMLYCLASTLLCSLFLWIGCALLHTSYPLFGSWFPLTVLTVSWATINPRVTVNLYGIIPVPAWAIAAFEVGVVYFVYLGRSPILGLIGLIPCALGWWYVSGGFSTGYQYRGYVKRGPDLKMTSTTKPLDGSIRGGLNPMGWLRDIKEKRKLRRLWKNSGLSDKDFKR